MMPPTKRPGRPPKANPKRSRNPRAKGPAKLTNSPGKTKLFSLPLPPELHQHLEAIAARDNLTKAEKVRRLICDAI